MQITDKSGALWNVRRTSTDKPGRTLCVQRLPNQRDTILPGLFGFYTDSLDDAKHKLNA